MRRYLDIDCPACKGHGEHLTRHTRRPRAGTDPWIRCRRCKGTGVL